MIYESAGCVFLWVSPSLSLSVFRSSCYVGRCLGQRDMLLCRRLSALIARVNLTGARHAVVSDVLSRCSKVPEL